MIFGGQEYVIGQITDYVLSRRKAQINNTEFPERTYDELYYFLPIDGEFCSCLLYENLLKEIMTEMSPNLDYALEHSRYVDAAWYKNLTILNFQINGWPEFREKHIIEGKFRPEYWAFLDLEKPVETWFKIKIDKDKKDKKDKKEFMNTLFAEEQKLRDALLAFELKLDEYISRLN